VPRLGVEWLAASSTDRALRLRGGLAYEPSPAPEQVGETNLIDNDKVTASLGAGLELPHLGDIVPRPFNLDGFVSFTRLSPRDHHKISPVDAVGDYRSSGHVLAAGITTRWRF
jgi:long-subunit fatty acid transport protein